MGGIAALHLGKRERDGIRYVGKVGTGFTMKVSADLRRRLDAMENPKAKLTNTFRQPHVRCVEPQLVAEVEYRDVTADGILRHPSFKGSRRTPTHNRRYSAALSGGARWGSSETCSIDTFGAVRAKSR